MALNLEAVSRALEASDKKARWTDEEKKRLKKIYGADADHLLLVERWTGLDTPDG